MRASRADAALWIAHQNKCSATWPPALQGPYTTRRILSLGPLGLLVLELPSDKPVRHAFLQLGGWHAGA